jgi:hypothetical protein
MDPRRSRLLERMICIKNEKRKKKTLEEEDIIRIRNFETIQVDDEDEEEVDLTKNVPNTFKEKIVFFNNFFRENYKNLFEGNWIMLYIETKNAEIRRIPIEKNRPDYLKFAYF